MGKFNAFLNEKAEAQLLLEAGFSRLMQIISGLVPSVKSFAILTWENPLNVKLSAEENRERNKNLGNQLGRGAYGFLHIKGKYGNFENPFVIMNMTEKEAISIGKHGHNGEKQESIIYGIVNGPWDITFKMIYTDGSDRPDAIRHVWKSIKKDVPTDFGGHKKTPEEKEQRKKEEKQAEEEAEFYSEYKGRQFIIPFFDDEEFNYDAAKFKHGTIIGAKPKPKSEGFEILTSCNIFHANKFPATIVEEIEKYVIKYRIPDGNLTSSMSWASRGYMFQMLKKANKL